MKEKKKAFNSHLLTKTKSRAGVGSDFSGTDPTATQLNINQQVLGEPVSGVNISKRDIVKKNSAAGPDNISAKFLQTFSS